MTSHPLLKALVVDDEPHARRGLAAMLEADGRIDVVGVCANVSEATEAVDLHDPDVLFLDIEMPDGSGFDLLDRLEGRSLPALVFVTAFESYALRAFDVRAIDYLLKPFSNDRLKETIDRLVQQGRPDATIDIATIVTALRDSREEGRGPLTRIAVTRPGRTEWIPTAQLEVLRADGDYVEVTTNDGRSELVRGPLGMLEGKLDRTEFLRTHRSYMVRMDRVKTLRLRSAGTAVLEMVSGAEVPVSARRRTRVQERLAGG